MAAKTTTKTAAKTAVKAKTTKAKTKAKTIQTAAIKTAAKTATKTAAKVKSAKPATKVAAKTAAKKTAVKAAKIAKSKVTATAKKRTLNPALKAPYIPSAQLAEIVGASPLPRQEVVSKLWTYIKTNGLQDKQTINADAKLKPVFGNKKSVTMFEMQKHVSKHLTKPTV